MFFPRPCNGEISLPGFSVHDTIHTSDIIPIRNNHSLIGNFEHSFAGIFTEDIFLKNRSNNLTNAFNVFQEIITPVSPLYFTDEYNTRLSLATQYPMDASSGTLSLRYAAPFYMNDDFRLSINLEHPFSINNNKLKLNIEDNYLEIDAETNKLDFKPPYTWGRGMTLTFIPAGEVILDYLPDIFDTDIFDGILNFDNQLNTPVLLGKISTGLGLKINPLTNGLTIDLIGGLNTTITGNVISMSYDYVSEIEVKKNQALGQIDSKKTVALGEIDAAQTNALTQINTSRTQATTAITTAQSTATSAITTAQTTATTAITTAQGTAISAITGAQGTAISAITAAQATGVSTLTGIVTSGSATLTGIITGGTTTLAATIASGETALGATIAGGLASIGTAVTAGNASIATSVSGGLAGITGAVSSGLFQIGAATAAGIAAITVMGFFSRINPETGEENTYITVLNPVEDNDAANKIYVDEKIAQVTANANSRLLQSTFDSFVTINTSNINSRVLQTDYDLYKNQTDNALLGKVNVADLSVLYSSLNTDIQSRVLTSTYNSFLTSNTAALSLKHPLNSYLTIIDQNLSIASSPAFSNITVKSGGALQFERDEGTTNLIGAKITGSGTSSILRLFNGSATALGRIDFADNTIGSPYMSIGSSLLSTQVPVQFTNTTDTTTPTAGSVIFSGGVGIAKSLRVQGVSAFNSAVAVGTPSNGVHATNINWVNSAISTNNSTINASIALKLDTTTYDAFVSANTAVLALKSSITYVDSQDALKVNLTTYNSFLTSNSTALATLTTSVASKVSQSSYDAFYTATNTSLAGKVTTNSNASLTTLLTNSGTNSGGQGHYFYQSQLVNRWLTGLYAEEGSGNTGCDWILTAYDNSGVFIRHALQIKRATGEVTLTGKLTLVNDLINDRSISADRTILDGLSSTILLKSDTTWVTSQLSLKQNSLSNISNVSTINQNLSITSDVTFNKLTIGNGSIYAADGNNAFIISGGQGNTNRYLYIQPNTPTLPAIGTGLLYTSSVFKLTKNNGTDSLNINNNTGLVSVGDLTVSTINNITSSELGQLANINSVAISNTQWSYLGNMNQDLNSSSNVIFGGVLVGTQSLNVSAVTRRDYVDAISYITAGVGLSKISSTLSVNAAQTQITSLGTLTGLTSSGIVNITNTTVSTSTITGSLTVAGGVGIVGSVFVGGNITAAAATLSSHLITKGSVDTLVGLRVLQSDYNTQVSIFNTDISNRLLTSTYNSFLTTNQAALDLKASISYVNGLVVTAGTGLSKAGTVLSVNAAQPGITSLGTLSTLAVSGALTAGSIVSGDISAGGNLYSSNSIFGGVNGFVIRSIGQTVGGILIYGGGDIVCLNTTASTSTSSGALRVLGGLGVSGALFGTTSNFSGSVTISANTQQLIFNNTNTWGDATVNTRSAGTRIIMNTALTASSYDYAIGIGSFSDMWFSTYTAFSWYSNSNTTSRVMSLVNGVLTLTTTNDSSSTTNGTLVVAGGAGIAKNLNVGGTTVTSSLITGSLTTTGLTALSPGLYDGTIVSFAARAEPNVYHLRLIEENISDFTWTANWIPILRMGTNSSTFLHTADSTSPSTGGLRINGGVGIAKSLSIGGNLAVSSIVGTGSSGPLNIDPNYTTNNYIRIWDELRIEGSGSNFVKITGTAITGGSFSGTTGTFSSALSATSPVFNGDVILWKNAAASGKTYVSQTFETSGYGMVVSGGLEQNVGPCAKIEMKASSTIFPLITMDAIKVTFQQTANSTSTSTGAVVFAGGIGVQGSLYGTSANFSGSITAGSINGASVGSINFNPNFTVFGTTFNTPVDTSFYTRIGRVVQINIVYSVASSSGTSSKITLYLPILPAGIQFSQLTMTSALEQPGSNKEYIAEIQPGVGANGVAYIEVRDISTQSISNGSFGGASGSARTYMIQFSYIIA